MRGFRAGSTAMWVACLAACSGLTCRKTEATIPLVSEREILTLQEKADGMLGEARARRCPRPVLRGEAAPGDAGDELRAVLGGAPETRSCLERLADGRNIEDLWRPEEDLPAAVRRRAGAAPRPLRTAPERAPELRETVAACAALYDRLQRAVAHAEACGPWRPGLACPDSYLPRFRLAQAVAAGAWFRLAEGKRREGLELALDGLRLLQDVERGGAAWIDAAMGAGASLPLAAVVESGLTAAADDPGTLDEVIREIGILIETEPHPSELLEGEYLHGVLLVADPAVLGPKRAPQGTSCDRPPPAAAPSDPDARDSAALTWLTLDRMVEAWRGACATDALPLDCRDGLERLHAAWREQLVQGPARFLQDLLERPMVVPPGSDLRDRILRALLGAEVSPGRWVTVQGRRRFLLAALRLQAAWLRQAAGAGACPGLESFEVEPLASLRRDPFSNRPIVVEPDGEGGFVFRPPVSMAVAPSDADVAVWAACPKAETVEVSSER